MAELHFTEQTTPSIPQAGKLKIYADSVDNKLKQIDSSGVIKDLTDSSVAVDNCRIGFLVYNDLATVGTPLVHVGGIDTILTNDGGGAQTLKTYGPPTVNELWDEANDEFIFTDLRNGDMIDIRIDLTITTSAANQEIQIVGILGQGGFSYEIPFVFEQHKAAGVKQVDRYTGIYIGDDNTRLNPGQLVFRSAQNATITVNGWYIKALLRG